jgi:DNA-binding CsgD family transcriptional regulator
VPRISLTKPDQVLDSTYDLELSNEEWVRGITTALDPMLRAGVGLVASVIGTDERRELEVFEPIDSPVVAIDDFNNVFGVHEHGGTRVCADRFERVFPHDGQLVADIGVGTIGTLAKLGNPKQLRQVNVEPDGTSFTDLAFLVVPDPDSQALLSFVARSHEPVKVTPKARTRWQSLQRHITAVFRVRQQIAAGCFDEDSAAFFEPDGDCVSRGPTDEGIRERLRCAIREWETNRSARTQKQRVSVEHYWENVLSGRWALVDRFDSDGRRHIVALPVSKVADSLRGLSRRQRDVMCLLAEGYSNKVIAFELGISESAVSSHLNNIFRKFGIEDRPSAIRVAQAAKRAA